MRRLAFFFFALRLAAGFFAATAIVPGAIAHANEYDVISSSPAVEPAGLPYFDADVLNDRFERFDPNVRQVAAMMQPPVLGDMEFSTSGPNIRGDEHSYPHIFSTDVPNPNRFWYTERANILQRRVPDNWDAMKLINTDRPDFTDVATVVGKGVTQWETGYFYDRRDDGVVRRQLQFAPSALVRFGRSDHFEWRVKWLGYTDQNTLDRSVNAQGSQVGYQDLELGFKYIVKEQNDWIPLQSIVTRMTVPLGSNEISANTIQPGATYIYNWQVRRWWFFRGASGFDYLHTPNLVPGPAPGSLIVARDSYWQGHQSFSSYMQIRRRFGMFTEWFMFYRGQTADTRPDHYHNYGFYLYATPNLQFDVRFGWRIGGRIDEDFASTGVSWRY